MDWFPFARAALIPGTLLLSACAAGPDYRVPAAESASTFQAGEALNQRRANTPAPPLDSWWQGFHDPVLERLVQSALAQNFDLAQARARLEQAGAGAEAAGAALWPAAQLNAQATRQRQSLADPLVPLERLSPDFSRNSSHYSAGIGMSWDLDPSGGNRRAAEAAQADFQAAAAGLAAARLGIVAATADTYIQLRTAQARLALARQQAVTQQDRLRLLNLLSGRGLAATADRDTAEGQLAAANAVIPVLVSAISQARHALDLLLGRQSGSPDPALDTPAALPEAPGLETAEGPAGLLRRRPDLILAERRVAAANARIGEALAGYYPHFSLSALLGGSAPQAGQVFSARSGEAQALLGLRWRLFDFGRVDAEVKAARGQEAEALASYRASVLRASAEVEDALVALVQREAQSRYLSKGEQSLTRARGAMQVAWQQGARSYLDVLVADERLQQMQDARIVAQAEALRAAIASFKALGGGWKV